MKLIGQLCQKMMHDNMSHKMVRNISEKKELLDNMSDQIQTNVGPCQNSLDVTLKGNHIMVHVLWEISVTNL